jgi:hypothetical protein
MSAQNWIDTIAHNNSRVVWVFDTPTPYARKRAMQISQSPPDGSAYTKEDPSQRLRVAVGLPIAGSGQVMTKFLLIMVFGVLLAKT